MKRLTRPDGTVVSFDRSGDGPPLVLVHGGFSDHNTNWVYVKPLLGERFTVYAIARRGRGETSATHDHRIEDEAADVAAVIEAIGEPVFLLGHSYGGQCALGAAALVPERIAGLIVYEAPLPDAFDTGFIERLKQLGARRDWEALVETFLIDGLQVPPEDVAALRQTPDWDPWIADAEATLGDMQAIAKYRFMPERFRALSMPVLLLVGSESPREIYVTDALASVLPNVQIVTLEGQAHEGMTTAPEQFAGIVTRFLAGDALGSEAAAGSR